MINDPNIPSYPVVHVSVNPDASAHVNAAGDHQNFPGGDLENTRAQVKAYAIAVATRLGRGVRMTTTDPDGEWKLGVYPDGEVVDLTPAPAKGRTRARTGSAQRRPGPVSAAETASAIQSATVLIEHIIEPTLARRHPTGKSVAPEGTLVATLEFSTGDSAIIGHRAIIGRNPWSVAADPGGSQLVVVSDHSRTVSRVHADVGWVDGKLTVSDRAAGNGTAITRPTTGRFELVPGESYELLHGDVLQLGTHVTCTVSISASEDRGKR